MILRLYLALCVCVILAACGKDERLAVNLELLSTDVYVEIAQHPLVLPFIALEDYAYQKQSFSLDRKSVSERALSGADKLLRDSADPKHPLAFDHLTVVVRTYGWNDGDIDQRKVCPLLTRKWARSVCNNPWAPIQQALPANHFELVDLSRLRIENPHDPSGCIDGGKPHRALPQQPGAGVPFCAAKVFGGEKDEFHHAIVRINGDLGVLWTVWRNGQYGETAEAMAEREGRAIAAFVHYALGPKEGFPMLHRTMCGLRRPGSSDSPKGADCSSLKTM